MLESIDHVNLVVMDLEGMADFYGQLLGLTISKRVTISGSWIDRTVNLKGVEADVIYLDPPAGPRVELLKYRNPSAARPEGQGASNTPGLRHMAFRVTDIERMVQRLRDSGVQFFSEVQRVPPEQVSYGGNKQKHLVYFHDPEGNVLEFCEYKTRAEE